MIGKFLFKVIAMVESADFTVKVIGESGMSLGSIGLALITIFGSLFVALYAADRALKNSYTKAWWDKKAKAYIALRMNVFLIKKKYQSYISYQNFYDPNIEHWESWEIYSAGDRIPDEHRGLFQEDPYYLTKENAEDLNHRNQQKYILEQNSIPEKLLNIKREIQECLEQVHLVLYGEMLFNKNKLIKTLELLLEIEGSSFFDKKTQNVDRHNLMFDVCLSEIENLMDGDLKINQVSLWQRIKLQYEQDMDQFK